MDTRQWAYRDGCTPDQIQSFVPASSARVKDLDVRRPAFRTYSIGADKSTTSTNIHLVHATVAVVGPGHRDGQIRQAKWHPDPETMGAKGWMACACSPPRFSSLCPCNTMRQAHAPPIHPHLMDRWAAIHHVPRAQLVTHRCPTGGGSDADPAASSPTSPGAMFPHSRPLTTSPFPLGTVRHLHCLPLLFFFSLCVFLGTLYYALFKLYMMFLCCPMSGGPTEEPQRCPGPTMDTPTPPKPMERVRAQDMPQRSSASGLSKQVRLMTIAAIILLCCYSSHHITQGF